MRKTMTHPRDLDHIRLRCLRCFRLIELRVIFAEPDNPFPVVVTCGACNHAMIQRSGDGPFGPVTAEDLAELRRTHPAEHAALVAIMSGGGGAA